MSSAESPFSKVNLARSNGCSGKQKEKKKSFSRRTPCSERRRQCHDVFQSRPTVRHISTRQWAKERERKSHVTLTFSLWPALRDFLATDRSNHYLTSSVSRCYFPFPCSTVDRFLFFPPSILNKVGRVQIEYLWNTIQSAPKKKTVDFVRR